MPRPTSRLPSRFPSRPAAQKTDSEVWFGLLFKFVSVPFVILLIAVIAKQTISIHQYSVEAETAGSRDVPAKAPGFIGDVLF